MFPVLIATAVVLCVVGMGGAFLEMLNTKALSNKVQDLIREYTEEATQAIHSAVPEASSRD
jgi:hypothetical protein